MKTKFLAAALIALAAELDAATIIETFDGGNISTHNGTYVFWSAFGAAPWFSNTGLMLPGDYFQSGIIGNNASCTLRLRVDIYPGGGFLNFDYAVSSEQQYDLFRVYINSVLTLSNSGSIIGDAGPIALASGTNIIDFVYSKDSSGAIATDAAAIDNVQVTNVVPEPSSTLLLGLGALGIAASRRRTV